MRRRELLSAGLGLLGTSYGFSPLGRCNTAASWSMDLADHRIVKFETFHSRDRYVRTLGPNAKKGPQGSGYSRPFRIATTNHGARGMGMCWPKEDVIAPFLGAKVGDLFDPSVGVTEEAHALDYVLHDLAGEILGKPVYELMGAHGSTEIETYSGAIYMEDLMPKAKPRGVSAVLDACQMDYDSGYRAFKLKIGRARWMREDKGDRRDIEVTRAVRDRFPNCKILVDANDGYSLERFLGYVTGVADCDLFWIEEPFVENRDGLVRLREHMHKVGCTALIADGEARTGSAPKLWEWGEYEKKFIDRFFGLAEEKMIDVCVFDIGTLGFTRWRQVMPILVEAGVAAAPHLWGCTPKPLYCAHLAAGVGNVLIVEGIPGVGSNLDYSKFAIRNGKLCVPDVPGFGISRTNAAGIGLRESNAG